MADRTITLSEREYQTLLEVVDDFTDTRAYLDRIPERRVAVHDLRRKIRGITPSLTEEMNARLRAIAGPAPVEDEKCIHGWVGGCTNCENAIGDYAT